MNRMCNDEISVFTWVANFDYAFVVYMSNSIYYASSALQLKYLEEVSDLLLRLSKSPRETSPWR